MRKWSEVAIIICIIVLLRLVVSLLCLFVWKRFFCQSPSWTSWPHQMRQPSKKKQKKKRQIPQRLRCAFTFTLAAPHSSCLLGEGGGGSSWMGQEKRQKCCLKRLLFPSCFLNVVSFYHDHDCSLMVITLTILTEVTNNLSLTIIKHAFVWTKLNLNHSCVRWGKFLLSLKVCSLFCSCEVVFFLFCLCVFVELFLSRSRSVAVWTCKAHWDISWAIEINLTWL